MNQIMFSDNFTRGRQRKEKKKKKKRLETTQIYKRDQFIVTIIKKLRKKEMNRNEASLDIFRVTEQLFVLSNDK